jgi:hypothetical protein
MKFLCPNWKKRQNCGDKPFFVPIAVFVVPTAETTFVRFRFPPLGSWLINSIRRRSEVSKAKDPKGQIDERRRRDQPMEPFLESINQADRTFSTDSRFLDLPVHLPFMGDSLRFWEQTVACLEKVDDVRGSVGWYFV